MDVTELRIGNWVKIHESDKSNSIVTVYKIEEDAINGWIFYQPIPLTEEWLLKFGFELDTNTDLYISNDEDCTLQIEGYLCKKMRDFNIGTELKHVHQLQNLFFALKNIELKINK